MPIPDLLRDLLTAVGPSGHEGPAAAVWRDAAAGFSTVDADTLGTSYARVGHGEGAPSLALIGHIDEIGLQLTHVGEDGLVAFTTLGGFSAEMLRGQRVVIQGRAGPVDGVVARGERSGEGSTSLTDLHIDLGTASRAETERLVTAGDAGVWVGAAVELGADRIVSRALDNRLGAYAVLEATRRLAAGDAPAIDVVAVASVQEELGHAGARTAAFTLAPRVALVVDVTWSTDVPGASARRAGSVVLGSGAAITRGPVVHPRVVELLVEAANEEGIPHSFEVYSGATHSDADAVQVARAGIPTGLVSIPIRYMHSPGEIASLDDVEATVALLVAFARRLTPDENFLR
jgi:putative aminopeptidase FrvX